MNRAQTIGAAVAALILVILLIAAGIRGPNAEGVATTAAAPPAQLDPMLEARTKGEPNAPIWVFEVTDFQCPFCLQFFEETLPTLEEEYIRTGKIRLTFMNLPLIQLHPNTAEAHELAMCAASQDQFWPIHDRLFETQTVWGPLDDPTPHFMLLADSLDLNREALDHCIRSGAVRSVVAADVQVAIRSKLNSTPTFIIEGGVLQGAVPIEDWRPILDSIYTAKTGGR